MLNTESKNKDMFKAHKLCTRKWNYSLLLHNDPNLSKKIFKVYHKM